MPEAARRRKRREVAFQTAEGVACTQRRPMQPHEAQALLQAIDKGSAAAFGLVKLSQLQLDALCVPWAGGRLTLLAWAAWRGRDAIAGALLRAGADASVREIGLYGEAGMPEGDGGSAAARACLSRALPMHAVYLVREVVKMRVAAAAGATTAAGKTAVAGMAAAADAAVAAGGAAVVALVGAPPSVQSEGGEQQEQADAAADQLWVDGIVSQPAAGQVLGLQQVAEPQWDGGAFVCQLCKGPVRWPLAFLSCQHRCCEPCMWERLRGGGEPTCPCQGPGQEGGEGSADGEGERVQGGWHGSAAPDEEALRRKRESKERWLQLPDTVPRSRDLAGTELGKPKFAARTAAEVARLYVGATRAQRQGNFWKAAATGNLHRLRALVEAGVDVDGVGEYGQTALHLASWHGQLQAVRLLCGWAGADVEVRANGGSSCCTAAAAQGHVGVVWLLVEAGADAAAPGAEGRTAWEHAEECGRGEALAALRELGLGLGGAEKECLGGNCKASNCSRSSHLGMPAGGSSEGDGKSMSSAAGSGSLKESEVNGRPCPAISIHLPLSADHPGAGSFSVDDGLTAAELDRLKALWATLERERDHGRATHPSPPPLPAEGGGSPAPAAIAATTPSAPSTSSSYGGGERLYLFDAEGVVRRLIRRVVRYALALDASMRQGVGLPDPSSSGSPADASLPDVAGEALPGMRFLSYRAEGASMAPHVDLAKQIPTGSGGSSCSEAAAAGAAAGHRPPTSSTHTFLLYLESTGAGGETLLLQREGPTVEASGGVLAAVTPRAGRLLVFPHKCPHAGAPLGAQGPKLLIRGEMY